jgi:hypothetical protein
MNRMISAVLITLLATQPVSAAPGDVSLTKPTVACPQAQLGDEVLQPQYDQFWRAYAERVATATKAVEDELTRLYEAAKSDGNLDLALFWNGLKKTLAESGHMRWEPTSQKKDWKRFGEAEFPDGLASILSRSEDSYGKAKDELGRGYKALEVALTKADKLEQALGLRKEFESLWGDQRSESVPAVQPKPKSVAEKLGLKGKAEYDARSQVLTVRYACNSVEELNDFDMSSGPNSATVRNRQLVVRADNKITHMIDFEAVTLAGTIIVPSEGSTKGSIGFEVTAGQKIFAYGNMSIRTPDSWKDIGGLKWNQPTRFRLYFGKPEITLATDTTRGAIPCGLMTVGRPIISGGKLGVSFTDLTISGKVSARVAQILAE